MNADPFSGPSIIDGLPNWFIATVYALPMLVWLIVWRRSHRFSLRSLFILVAVYAGLLTILPRPFRSHGHDPAEDSFLEEILRHRQLF